FGLVAIEAQAAGTPVIAASVGGLPVAVQDGRTGFLVPGHDPAAYARVLREFAANPHLCAGMGEAAARHAKSFGWDTAASTTAGVYAEAMQAHRRRA
ncbi:glycosyltransferase, partial [Streptomyces sp. NPDC054775]